MKNRLKFLGIILVTFLFTACTSAEKKTVVPDIYTYSLNDNNCYDSMIYSNSSASWLLYDDMVYELDGEQLKPLFNALYMGVTEKYIYYFYPDGVLSRYELSTGKITELSEKTVYADIYTHGDDAFIRCKDVENYAGTSVETQLGNVYYYQDDSDECTILNELEEIDEYKIISEKVEYEGTHSQIKAITSPDGWYASFDYQAFWIPVSGEMVKIPTYGTTEENVGLAYISDYAALFHDEIFIMVPHHQERNKSKRNFPSEFSLGDSLYQLDSENVSLAKGIYDTQDNDRIVGYNISDDTVYIYREQGIYVITISDLSEKKICDLEKANAYYFEWNNGKLYIIYKNGKGLRLKCIET